MLNLELRTAAAMLARHNQPLAQRIQDRADGLAENAKRWRPDTAAAADTAAVGRYNEMYESVESLHELVINWLGDVQATDRQGNLPK